MLGVRNYPDRDETIRLQKALGTEGVDLDLGLTYSTGHSSLLRVKNFMDGLRSLRQDPVVSELHKFCQKRRCMLPCTEAWEHRVDSEIGSTTFARCVALVDSKRWFEIVERPGPPTGLHALVVNLLTEMRRDDLIMDYYKWGKLDITERPKIWMNASRLMEGGVSADSIRTQLHETAKVLIGTGLVVNS